LQRLDRPLDVLITHIASPVHQFIRQEEMNRLPASSSSPTSSFAGAVMVTIFVTVPESLHRRPASERFFCFEIKRSHFQTATV
jgi:hypothetical protein